MTSKYFLDVGCGFIPGRSIVNIFGNVFDAKSSDIPCTIWALKTLYEFPTIGEVWQIRSTSPNDSASGSGARAVIIDSLDSSYQQNPLLPIALNGTSPVFLPGSATYFRANGMLVVDSGSSHTNEGDIILESLVGNLPRAIIIAGGSNSLAFVYTVPVGHSLWIPNFFVNAAKSGGGKTTWTSASHLRLPNGTDIVAGTQAWEIGAIPIVVPTGFVIGEKQDFSVRIEEVGANGININFQVTGILTDLTNPAVIQRRPTAWTEY